MTKKGLLLPLITLSLVAGCDDSGQEPDVGPPHGPPGGIVEVDPGDITVSSAGSGGTAMTGTGGSSGFGGGASTGGVSGAAGTAGTAGSGGAAVVLPGSGVGQPCETADDCAQGLVCNIDAIDYVVHKQCTAACASTEQCTGMFGDDTMCIGAELCTLTCLADTDCPELTVCNDFGWCERSGPGSGVPYCSGSATPCSLLGESECTLALGCTDDSECSGVASSCYSQFSSYSCTSQEGCYWSTYTDSCSGSASSCYSQFSELSCALQEGCYWSSDCTGTATPCDTLLPALCEGQPGCVLMQ